MRVIAFDTETHLLKPGLTAPRIVCVTWAERRSPERIDRGIVLREDGLHFIESCLRDDGVTLIGHNIYYDLGVVVAGAPHLLPLVFTKFEKGLIGDTMTRQQLLDIATGDMKFFEDEDTGEITITTYNLDALAWRLLKKFIKKKDTWRLKYALLDGVPLSQWPEEAIRYAVDDAVTTLEVFEAQSTKAGGEIPDAVRQHKAAWVLHLMSMWGIRTDGPAVVKLKEHLAKDYAEAIEALKATGFFKQKKQKGVVKDVRDMATIKARVDQAFAALGKPTPMTEPSKKYPRGQIATDKKTFKDSGDPELIRLAEAGATGKLLNTYVPLLESGTMYPINARFNVLVETGRTSCSKPNLQNPPRKGGVRECFIPRKGRVFVSADYSTLELRALAQVNLDLFGRSVMAEVLQAGDDLHLNLAASMLGISAQEAAERAKAGDVEVDEARQLSKIANFGFPGGLGAKSFVEYAAGYGVIISEDKAHELHEAFFRMWAEMGPYFQHIEELNDRGWMVQARSGRVRGEISYCSAANSYFQGLAADGAKDALWRVTKECFLDPTSALYGSRPVIFLHDEIIIETPWENTPQGRVRASAAAMRLATVMRDAMSEWIPDVPILADPVMMRRWFKGAKAVFDEAGNLLPSKPQESKTAEGKKKVLWVADVE